MSPKAVYETEYIEPYNACKNCVCVRRPENIVVKEVINENQSIERKPIEQKPKKNFWQQIFGDGWIGRKRQKNKFIHNTSECVDKNCKLCHPKKNATKPVCCCKKQECQKGCCPNSKSICGCQFYFSLENRPKRYCCSRRRSLDSERMKSADEEIRKISTLSVHRTTSVLSTSSIDDECNRDSLKIDNRSLPQSRGPEERRSFDYTNRQRSMSLDSRNRERRRSSKKNNKQFQELNRGEQDQVGSNHKLNDNDSNIRIGVTFTKEQIKYFKPHCAVTSITNGEECEILNTDLKDDLGRKVKLKICADQDAKDAPPRRVASVVLDDYYNMGKPKCESFSREISPLLLRRLNCEKTNGHENDTLSIKINQPEQTYKRCSVKEKKINHRERTSLDKRVSEILEKLYDIEEKINVIEKKSTEQRDFRVDSEDGRKGSVTVLVKKEPRRSIEENKNNTHSNSFSKDDTVIEIRHVQSKIDSPFEIQSSSELFDKRKRQSNRKIIIKIPNTERYTNHSVTVPNDNNDSSFLRNSMEGDRSHWCNVSNDLKMSAPKLRCYCYNCIVKRNVRCKY
uniref:Uncharacterized protein n=1 Tax=Homalodisca liturata TaxID=320908 RepID=A0A1B6JV84_9HEMI